MLITRMVVTVESSLDQAPSLFSFPRGIFTGRWFTTLYHSKMVHGILNGMEIKIDEAGRIVVPKPLRDRLGFRMDTELEAIELPEGVLLKRVQPRPSMAKIDGLWVHQGAAENGANWDRILEGIREERIQSVLKA
jgi:AbrB family looped-hinge helix DNA binding protein